MSGIRQEACKIEWKAGLQGPGLHVTCDASYCACDMVVKLVHLLSPHSDSRRVQQLQAAHFIKLECLMFSKVAYNKSMLAI